MKLWIFFLLFSLIFFVYVIYSPIKPFRKLKKGDRYKFYKTENKFELEGKYPIMKKELGKSMIILLEKIVTIFEKNNITYWVSCGNLLGIVRHKGLIPWDDDMDLNVPLDEINKMKKILLKNNIGFYSANGGYKLFDKKSFPFVDIIVTNKVKDKWMLCYPLDKNKNPTYETSIKWPQECFEDTDVFPLVKAQFEHFYVNVPKNYKELVFKLYGKDCLKKAIYKKMINFNNHKIGHLFYMMNITKG